MKKALTILILATFSLTLFAQKHEFRYSPDWESIRSSYEVPGWFLDAKFRIFLHWGSYCVPAISSEKE